MRWIVDGVDIIMGFDEVDQYKTASEPYHGAIIGRYANRIANAKFTLNNKEYYLNQNHGKHLLHGGDQAFHNTIWTILSRSKSHVEKLSEVSIILTLCLINLKYLYRLKPKQVILMYICRSIVINQEYSSIRPTILKEKKKVK